MTENAVPDDIDPFIAERIIAIRDRFGLRGLRAAQALIEMEISIFDDIRHGGDAADEPDEIKPTTA